MATRSFQFCPESDSRFEYPQSQLSCVAYLSMEFLLSEALPIFVR